MHGIGTVDGETLKSASAVAHRQKQTNKSWIILAQCYTGRLFCNRITAFQILIKDLRILK